jgi:hypothetical protein
MHAPYENSEEHDQSVDAAIPLEDLDVVIHDNTHVILGQGSFAKVYLCRHKRTHTPYALKVVS